jgi:hypothetical protein
MIDAEYISTIITSLVTIVVNGYVFLALRERLQTQQNQVDLMQKNMGVMQKVVDMFKPDTIDQLVKVEGDLIRKKAEQKKNDELNKFMTEHYEPLMKDYRNSLRKIQVKNLIEKSERLEVQKEYEEKHQELMTFVLTMLIVIKDKEEQSKMITSNFPLNKELIEGIIEDLNPDFVKELMNSFHQRLSSGNSHLGS